MIIPLLTQILPEPNQRPDLPAKPRTPSGQDNRARRDDDRDFASVMADRKRDARQSDRPQDTRKREPAAGAREAPEKPAGRPESQTRDAAERPAERDKDMAAVEEDQAEAPRRQVTIPDLPPTREPAPLPSETEGDVAAGSPEDVVAVVPLMMAEPQQPKAEVIAQAAPAATTETAEQVKANPTAILARMGETPDARNAVAIMTAGAADTPERGESETLPLGEIDGEAAEDQDIARRRGAPQLDAQASSRIPAASQTALQVAQSARLRDIAETSAHSAAEDRRAARTREPVARAVEAAAAATAPTPQTVTAQTSGAAQMAILQHTTREALSAKEKSATAFTLDGETESLRFDMRGTTGTPSTHQPSHVPATARSDMARHVATQIAEFARNMPDRPVDVSLSPEELGRVRLSISTGDGGVILQVLAERPETLDLMRRHADQLARELADLGFASIDLAFGQGRDPESQENDGDGSASSGANARSTDETGEIIAEDHTPNRLTLSDSGGLDIRI